MPLEALLHLAGIAEPSFVWYVCIKLLLIQNHLGTYCRGNKSKRLKNGKEGKQCSQSVSSAMLLWFGWATSFMELPTQGLPPSGGAVFFGRRNLAGEVRNWRGGGSLEAYYMLPSPFHPHPYIWP